MRLTSTCIYVKCSQLNENNISPSFMYWCLLLPYVCIRKNRCIEIQFCYAVKSSTPHHNSIQHNTTEHNITWKRECVFVNELKKKKTIWFFFQTTEYYRVYQFYVSISVRMIIIRIRCWFFRHYYSNDSKNWRRKCYSSHLYTFWWNFSFVNLYIINIFVWKCDQTYIHLNIALFVSKWWKIWL